MSKNCASTSGWQRPRQESGFYGWWMVGLCALTFAMTGPGQTIGISAFIDPMMETLDLTRTEISTAYLIGTIASGLIIPLVGSMLDRLGSRVSMALIGGLFGVVLASMAGVIGLVGLVLGFSAIRIGQTALSLVSATAVTPWFDRRRGFALGVTTAVGASLIFVFPLGSLALIASFGWRSAWGILGASVLLIVVPVSLKGVVDQPLNLGQMADGRGPLSEAAAHQRVSARSFRRREALMTSSYWIITTSMAAVSAVGTALTFHQVDILGDQGLTPFEAAANFLPQMVGTLVATLVVGAAVDRFSVSRLVVGVMIMLIGALLLVEHVTPGVAATVYGLVLGAASGASRIVEAGATPRLFGLAHLGSIRGTIRFTAVVASAVGPVLMSTTREMLGTYVAVMRWTTCIPLAVIALTLRSRRLRDASGERASFG